MNYKEIYDELRTVLWGDEFAGTKNESEEGIGFGYLNNLYNPFHTGATKIDEQRHARALKICRKFADKLYLDTKDEYVIKLLEEICIFTGECWIHADMSEIEGTSDDPEYMFDSFKKEEAKQPVPEDKYRLIIRRKLSDGSIEEEIRDYKFYLEAKSAMDFETKFVRERENSKDLILVDEEMCFKTKDEEYLLEKREG